MPFPIYYQGKILFRYGKPAFSLACCCGPCITNCGAVFQGTFYEVSTLFISPDSNSLNWSYDDGTTNMVFSQTGNVESLGNCNFRVPGEFIVVEPPDFSNAPIVGYAYGSYRNGRWSFSGLDRFSYAFDEPNPNAGVNIAGSPYSINFQPFMDTCGF
jgi:hypothetical protein